MDSQFLKKTAATADNKVVLTTRANASVENRKIGHDGAQRCIEEQHEDVDGQQRGRASVVLVVVVVAACDKSSSRQYWLVVATTIVGIVIVLVVVIDSLPALDGVNATALSAAARWQVFLPADCTRLNALHRVIVFRV
jgi:hypothetical protein